jgi:hypothetical protein
MGSCLSRRVSRSAGIDPLRTFEIPLPSSALRHTLRLTCTGITELDRAFILGQNFLKNEKTHNASGK